MANQSGTNNTPSQSFEDYDESNLYTPQSSASKKRKAVETSTGCTAAMIHFGICLGGPRDDQFGHLPLNKPIEGERCAYFYNVAHNGKASVEGLIPKKTVEFNNEQPFTPPTNEETFDLAFKGVNMYTHECAHLFIDGKMGTTIAFPALAYSKKIYKYVKELCGDKVVFDFEEDE
eukprot:scaffold132315_cov14-Prasinocladus_malaysianus.AAC.3